MFSPQAVVVLHIVWGEGHYGVQYPWNWSYTRNTSHRIIPALHTLHQARVLNRLCGVANSILLDSLQVDAHHSGQLPRVGHHVLLCSFKERNVLLLSFFEFLATQKNNAFFCIIFLRM